jgi:hypothetical protein
MHCWALSKVSIKILLCHSFRSAREDTNQSLSLIERSRVSVGILRQHFCEPFLRGGVCATFLPNDAAAAAAAAAAAWAETRACRDGVPGVYEDLRPLVPAVLRCLVRECTSYTSHFN